MNLNFFKGKRNCHIENEWLLIYPVEDNELYLYPS
ncbi:MAG: hypothetical protein D3904_04385 [Candidatus Electrothrix sp. EH2]|nr:hypothetical protein [Candidatus Electrothrix sp. EH2]